LSTLPLHDPRSFDWRSIGTATSLAALTYIGFDGVTTLAEEVRQPERSVPFATVLVCLLTGVFSVIEVYLAAMVWPDYRTYPNPETAFLDVTKVVGGNPLFQAMGLVLILACVGSGLTGQAGLARLLFGMGRDGVLPRRWFAHLNPKNNIPSNNVLLTGLLTVVGVLFVPYETAAELLNFGAFLAFMGVNGAVICEYWVRRPKGERRVRDLILPGCGFLFCLAIWLSLPSTAKIAGGVWFVVGVAYLAFRTKGFSQKLAFAEFPAA
jgi:amino acid transporter